MKLKSFFLLRRCLLTLLPVLALALAGCSLFSSSGKNKNVMAQPAAETSISPERVATLHIGDTVSITFAGPPDPMASLEPTIKEDGTITLPDIGRVQAVGKTPGELEDAIHDLYVPKYLTHLNVSVKTSNDRVYYISGEVRSPGRLLYSGTITVSKAITSAGDCTDFADRSDIILTRANGDRFELNLNRIVAGTDPDPPVYPGDQIKVTRRIF